MDRRQVNENRGSIVKNVTLLGRGPSLKYLNVLPESEIVVLANDFDRDITNQRIK